MPAEAVIQVANVVDRRAGRLRAAFGDGRNGYLDFAFATELFLRVGREPSRATIEIPVTAWAERASQIALVAGGPFSEIKGGTRCRVSLQETVAGVKRTPWLLFSGSVVQGDHHLGPDGAIVEAVDDKWLLEGVKLVGAWIALPQYDANGNLSSHNYQFRQRGPLYFNPAGRPNCMDTDYGVLFAPYPDYGWTNLDTDEPEAGAAKTKARSWRLVDVLDYIWRTHYKAADNYCFGLGNQFPEFQHLAADYIVWPSGFASALAKDDFSLSGDADDAQEIQDNDRDAGMDGKAHNLNLDGWNLLDALNEVLAQCGSYGLYLSPLPSGKSVLEVKPLGWIPNLGKSAQNLERRESGTANGKGVARGAVRYDWTNCYSSVVVRGDMVLFEIRVEWNPAAAPGTQALLPAWTRKNPGDAAGQTEEELFIQLLNTDAKVGATDVTKTMIAWGMCTNKFPRVFCAYRINPAWNWLAGTKYDYLSRVLLSPPVIANLLSGMSDDGDTAAYKSGSLRRFQPRPVVVEFYDNTNNWKCAEETKGLEIDDEGNFYLPALREAGLAQGQYGVGSWKGNIFDPANITARRIRVTLAFALDWETLWSVAVPSSPAAAWETADPASETEIAPGLQRQYVANVGPAYREYLRKDSWPVPESVTGASAAADKCGDGSELLYDGDWLWRHANRRLAVAARAVRSGELICPGFVPHAPGFLVKNVGDRFVGAAVVGVHYTSREKQLETALLLA